MSKRFGRNQRRRAAAELAKANLLVQDLYSACATLERTKAALTAQLAETGAALNAELGSEFRLADGEQLWVIPETNVRSYRDTTEYRADDRRYEFLRTCELDLIQFSMTEGVIDMIDGKWRSRDIVSFRGVRWVLDEMRASPMERVDFNSIGGMQFTAVLRAIGRVRK